MSILGAADEMAALCRLVVIHDRWLEQLNVWRAQASGLDELLAIASVCDQVDAERRRAVTKLSRLESLESQAWAARAAERAQPARDGAP